MHAFVLGCERYIKNANFAFDYDVNKLVMFFVERRGELLPYVVWVVLPRWFIITTMSSNTLTAALGYISLNNVKEEMFGKEFCSAFSLHLKRKRDEIQKKRDEEIVEKLLQVQRARKSLGIFYVKPWQ